MGQRSRNAIALQSRHTPVLRNAHHNMTFEPFITEGNTGTKWQLNWPASQPSAGTRYIIHVVAYVNTPPYNHVKGCG